MKAALKSDSLKMRGYLEFCLRDARTGEVIRRGRRKNTVTAVGRSWALKKLNGSSDTALLTQVGVGSTSTAPTSNDSNLNGYLTMKIAGTTAQTTATNSACTYTAAVSWASNETFTNSSQIGEFGLYNASVTTAAFTMFNHLNTTTYINFGTSNTLSVTITITN